MIKSRWEEKSGLLEREGGSLEKESSHRNEGDNSHLSINCMKSGKKKQAEHMLQPILWGGKPQVNHVTLKQSGGGNDPQTERDYEARRKGTRSGANDTRE